MWTVDHDICIYIYIKICIYKHIYNIIYIYTVYLVISWILKVNRNVHTCLFLSNVECEHHDSQERNLFMVVNL